MRTQDWLHEVFNGNTNKRKCGSMSFSISGGELKIYSYGTEIARRLSCGTTIISDNNFSSSTTKHLSWVYNATRSRPCRLPGFARDQDFCATRATEAIKKRIKILADKEIKRKKWTKDFTKEYEDLRSFINSMNEILDINIFQGEKALFSTWVLLGEDENPEYVEKQRKAREKRLKEQINLWKSGISTYMERGEKTYLRINFEKGMVESSQGIRYTFDKAKVIYKALERAKHGDKIDEKYTVIKATDKEIVIGCHHLQRKEVEEIYRTLEKLPEDGYVLKKKSNGEVVKTEGKGKHVYYVNYL